MQKGFVLPATTVQTPIIPLITGESDAAIALSTHLNQQGIHAPAIRPPTVAPNAARVRLSLRCDLTDEHVDQLIKAFASAPKA
mgnify:FL=1